MSEASPKPGLEGVIAAAKQAPGRGLPPVHLWHPAHCGEIDIVIKRNGTWFHEGTPIGREALVRLFSTVLRRDPDGFHLVTPVEKMRIVVEDAPFIAVRVDRVGEDLKFVTNVGDYVAAGILGGPGTTMIGNVIRTPTSRIRPTRSPPRSHRS